MREIIYRRDTCRSCGSKDIEHVFSLKPSPVGDAYVKADRLHVDQPSYPLDLFICSHCGLAQIVDVIDPEILYGDYIYVTGSSLGLAGHFRTYAQSVIKRCGLKSGSLVIDIGSNDGTLLQSFQAQGMNVLGIEPATHIAAEANAKGIRTIDQFLTPEIASRIASEYSRAKLITSNNVFANIDDLQSWVDAVEKLLSSDGVYVFESFYLADVVKNMVFDFLYHEHLSAFSVKPIKHLIERYGLKLVAVEHVATKGGSLRYFVQRPGGPMADDGSVAKVLAAEHAMGLYEKRTYVAFAEKIDRLKSQTQGFLAKAKKNGKNVAGFGASITGTTLIYHFEIGEYLDYLVDDNPAKQGRYSPGLHIPVLASAALYEKEPDYIVALAWRFAEPYIAKNQAYIENGGHFVIPVPEFRVVGKSAQT
jgi:C-methyltransferase C-terminal domain/Putative zinc binding domain/Methyltransferase domain